MPVLEKAAAYFSARHQFLRFLVVGVLNTAISYLIYAALLAIGLNFAYANLGAVLLGIVISFKNHARLVFRQNDNRLIVRYACFWLLIYGANIAIIAWLKSLGFNSYSAGAVALAPIVVLSFVLQKFFVFRDRS